MITLSTLQQHTSDAFWIEETDSCRQGWHIHGYLGQVFLMSIGIVKEEALSSLRSLRHIRHISLRKRRKHHSPLIILMTLLKMEVVIVILIQAVPQESVQEPQEHQEHHQRKNERKKESFYPFVITFSFPSNAAANTVLIPYSYYCTCTNEVTLTDIIDQPVVQHRVRGLLFLFENVLHHHSTASFCFDFCFCPCRTIDL